MPANGGLANPPLYEMAERLLAHGADVNAVHSGIGRHSGLRGYTPPVFAVSGGLVRLSKLLIQAGANIHYRVPAGVNTVMSRRRHGGAMP